MTITRWPSRWTARWSTRSGCAALALGLCVSVAAQQAPDTKDVPQDAPKEAPKDAPKAPPKAAPKAPPKPAGKSAAAAAPMPDPKLAVTAPGMPAAVNAANQATYERQLEAIREALLQATTQQAPTRVVSTAWVDDKGALRELSHFQSEAHVRGVRIARYVDEQADQDGKKEAPKVQVDVLPWSLRVAQSGCQDPPRPWKLPLQVQTTMSAGFNGSQHYASNALLDMSQSLWLAQMKQSTRWRAFEARTPPATQYERYLIGPNESYQGWVAVLSLHPQVAPEAVPTSGMFFFKTANPNFWSWTLALTLTHTGKKPSPMADTVPVRLERAVHIPLPQSLHDPAAWMRSLQTVLNDTLGQWVQLLDDRLRCEPPQFAVEGTPAVLTVQAGQGSGLRMGDRVLVVNRTEVPSRMLESGARAPMALAEVVQVGLQSSRLRHLAGPLPTGGIRDGDWVALPL